MEGAGVRPNGRFKKERQRLHALIRDVVGSIKAPESWSRIGGLQLGEERLGHNASPETSTSSVVLIGAAALVAACMMGASVAYFVLRYLPPACSSPHFRKCDDTHWAQQGGGHRPQWYYLATSFGEHCLQWIPDQLPCLNQSHLHYGSQADCREACEKTMPSPSCDNGVAETMIDCGERDPQGLADVLANSRWWFYDAYLGSCQNWTDVCIDHSYTSLEQCAYQCLPH